MSEVIFETESESALPYRGKKADYEVILDQELQSVSGRSAGVLTRTLLRSMFKTILRVQVGPDKQAFEIHKEFVCSVSPFFTAACSDRWGAQGKNMLELPEEKPEIFELFVQWLYTRKLDDERHVFFLPEFSALVETYVLADKLGITQLKNDCIDRIILCKRVARKMNEEGRGKARLAVSFDFVERNTLPSCALRKLLADFFAWDMTPEKMKENGHNLPHAILVDVSAELSKMYLRGNEGAIAPYLDNVCISYHEHDDLSPARLCARRLEGRRHSQYRSGERSMSQ
ncbi:MAG: hypothetical protein M1827_002692 [Pycnora praestabilis]|nr:MAG: hypothetical protein M1827_002692 [Pycnora praestabilis]